MLLGKAWKEIRIIVTGGLLVFGALASYHPSFAQSEEVSQGTPVSSEESEDEGLLEKDAQFYVGLGEALQRKAVLKSPDIADPSKLETLFFTLWQHELLKEAIRGFRSRPPLAHELDDPADAADRPAGLRELTLGGIVYATSEEWTVWLNGQRVTPDSIPEQVIDIQVGENYLELKWFDSYTNLVYPIRIRPHQRFNLDTRIFLPGTL